MQLPPLPGSEFSIPAKEYPLSTPLFHPFPGQPLVCFISIWIYQFLDLSYRRTLCVWLLSRTITGIRYLLAIVWVGALFFSVAGYHAIVWMHCVLMDTRVCLDTYSHFSWIYSWEWISGVYGNAMLNITRRRHAVFRNDYTILCSHNQ